MTVPLRLAVLGDSIAYGLGASRSSDTLAQRLVDGLAAHGHPATTLVLAVPGSRTSSLPGQAEHAAAWDPDVAVVVIGANDITHLEPLGPVTAAFGQAVGTLRRAGAQVVVAPAPDLSSVPHVPVSMRAVVREASERLRQEQIQVAEAAGALVADADGATSRAFAADRGLFSADRFHPSSAGYAVIAQSLLPQVLAAVQSVIDRRGG